MIPAGRYQDKFKCQQNEAATKVILLFGRLQGGGKGFDEKLKELVANDKRGETLAQRDEHLRKAANHFYTIDVPH